MERISQVVGPLATNVHVLADPASREAIAIDTAIPSLAWIRDELAERGWTLKLIVSTHGHWDHTGDNAAVAAHTGADIAVHPLDRSMLETPEPRWAPFEIPPSVPAVELAEGGEVGSALVLFLRADLAAHAIQLALHEVDDALLLGAAREGLSVGAVTHHHVFE